MVDVEAILSSSDLQEQVNKGRDEHKQLYHQLTAIQVELQTLEDSESLDDSVNQRRNQIHARFDAVVLKFEAYLMKYNMNRTTRKLHISDEWRERLEIKAEVVHLKTSLGLVNLGAAMKTKTKAVADNSAAIVTKAKVATDNSVAKAKEAKDSRVAKVRTAIRDEQAKIQAAMEHPNIVKFMGVAWNSLTEDLCSVAEFMDGGDLKMLLDQFEEQNYSTGFDYTKVRIAMHVARALTYLHLLDPPVIHRDLKSKNILLNQDLDAKLTDFGISRERTDRAMTAGVGTSLWMAPEVMLGQSYDEKADIFSFGVVLAELSTHLSPYSNAKRPGSTQQMPLIAILHDITVGKLSVEFSEEGPESVVELGLACVSRDPKERPTAPEALYRLHTILTYEMSI
ncbi:hypothetical protein BBO99_00004252 [Phytophthora kernoviae]|uniref:Protein kinase domain-containing protein n=2 Tax=Phytophthora kernoviae TaxID=325452 RepID=A0A421GS66_9STRA|nr:hypothetical protein G195_005830 [Phytophthora kernoviae 00238/432]KAG2522937.1 hypothetical protein JM16_005595 [Phytophthora kernoviae]KAG2524547.1 hypothetical protein JM18_005331 [Phytophthora kernoviae]RLN38011.1 hypothetical protein BBI17_002322 [Phytophthora kernoviae]RLN80773.1 hypothetical protein BBO99_00004252 [Phytophthora kernoviae]